MNDKIFEILWKKIPSILSLLAFFFNFIVETHREIKKLFFLLKTKKFWLKESVIKRVVIPVGVSCRRHLSIWLKHHGMKFFFSFSSFPFHQKPFSSLSALLCYVICFHSFFQNSTTCFDLCIGDAWCSLHSDLKTIIVIHSRSHYEMRRGSWRNLDLEKYIFQKNNLIELNWSQRLNAAAFDKKAKKEAT